MGEKCIDAGLLMHHAVKVERYTSVHKWVDPPTAVTQQENVMHMDNRFFAFYIRYDYLPGETSVFLMREDTCVSKGIDANFFGLHITADIPNRWPNARAREEMRQERAAVADALEAEFDAMLEAKATAEAA